MTATLQRPAREWTHGLCLGHVDRSALEAQCIKARLASVFSEAQGCIKCPVAGLTTYVVSGTSTALGIDVDSLL